MSSPVSVSSYIPVDPLRANVAAEIKAAKLLPLCQKIFCYCAGCCKLWEQILRVGKATSEEAKVQRVSYKQNRSVQERMCFLRNLCQPFPPRPKLNEIAKSRKNASGGSGGTTKKQPKADQTPKLRPAAKHAAKKAAAKKK